MPFFCPQNSQSFSRFAESITSLYSYRIQQLFQAFPAGHRARVDQSSFSGHHENIGERVTYGIVYFAGNALSFQFGTPFFNELCIFLKCDIRIGKPTDIPGILEHGLYKPLPFLDKPC